MTVRRDITIEVETEPNSDEICMVYPLVKGLVIYWSVCKQKWFVSCRCSEAEARGIKETYSDKCKPVIINDDGDEYIYDKFNDSWSLSK